MSHTVNKSVLFIASVLLCLYLYGISTASIVIILVAFIISSISTIFMLETKKERNLDGVNEQLKKVTTALIIIYLSVSIASPILMIFIPAVVYDAFCYNLKIAWYVILLPAIYYLATDFSLGFWMMITLCIFSFLLATTTSKRDKLTKEFIALRDNTVENELVLKHNTELIRQNQDDMINMATLQERNRIAREIHDNVGHMITRSILQVGALKVINKDEKLDEHFINLSDTLNLAMQNIRQSVHDLYDESIDLKTSIEGIVRDIDKFKINFEYDMDSYVPKDIKYAFITITKEAVNNAVKYSNGDTLNILLREHPGFYQLLIEDNGTGATINNTGIGLNNMKDRVNSINGTIKISTDNCFRILISVMKQAN